MNAYAALYISFFSEESINVFAFAVIGKITITEMKLTVEIHNFY